MRPSGLPRLARARAQQRLGPRRAGRGLPAQGRPQREAARSGLREGLVRAGGGDRIWRGCERRGVPRAASGRPPSCAGYREATAPREARWAQKLLLRAV